MSKPDNTGFNLKVRVVHNGYTVHTTTMASGKEEVHGNQVAMSKEQLIGIINSQIHDHVSVMRDFS